MAVLPVSQETCDAPPRATPTRRPGRTDDAGATQSPANARWQQHKPFFGAVVVLLALCGWMYWLCQENTGGTFVYPLDDTYIHLAMAKTLAQDGIWGVNATDGFASAASSLAWPVQLAALVWLFGPQDWLPLALNAVYGVLALAVAAWVLRTAGASRRFTLLALLLAIFFTSLPVLVLLGMEHTMQAAVDLLFAAVAARTLAGDKSTWGQCFLFGLLGALVTATRYEGIFLIVAFVLAALLLRRGRELGVVSALAALPIVGFGLYSVAHGSLFLPNPIAVKSDLYDIHSLQDFLNLILDRKLAAFLSATPVYVPLLLALFGVLADAAGRNQLKTRDRLFVLIVVLTAGMHLFGASIGWFTRYEAYLVFMALIAVGVSWHPVLQAVNLKLVEGDNTRAALVSLSALLLGLVLAAPFIQRMRLGLFSLPAASKNIHDQQIQMARFVKEYYDGQAIVINDLGAIAWYTSARPVDMAGLATVEMAKAYTQPGKRTPMFLKKLAHEKGARIAMVYNGWLPGRTVPAGWRHAGSWTIQNNVICGAATVSFYALDDAAEATLLANLRAFAPSLPVDVTQEGQYTN